MIIRAVTADKGKRILRRRGKRFIMPSMFLSVYFNPDEISTRLTSQRRVGIIGPEGPELWRLSPQ
jgi:hypothetical protein